MAVFRRNVPQRELFDRLAGTWWDDEGSLHSLSVLLDPVRLPFIEEAFDAVLGAGPSHILDIGAGGGALAEAVAADGRSVLALDPSVLSLLAGKEHSGSSGKRVAFVGGVGERLPFEDGSFDAVLCMEVLEHVDDPGAVVDEAARVLRRGGVFVYSGPNRSAINAIGLVFMAQDLFGIVPRGTHRWRDLGRPREMESLLAVSGIEPGSTVGVGLKPGDAIRAVPAILSLLLSHSTHTEAARRIRLAIVKSTKIAYQGYGVKRI